MRNDDPEYLNQLERGLATAEEEIKILEDEVRKWQETVRTLEEELNPTHMGEPVIRIKLDALINNGEELTRLRAENAALKADAERIDYLEMNPRNAQIIVDGETQDCLYYAVAGAFGVRLRDIIDAAIDAARKPSAT